MDLTKSLVDRWRVWGPWIEFEDAVREHNRHFPNADYLKELLDACDKLGTSVEGGDGYFRARIRPHDREQEPLRMDEMGAPKPVLARGGRLNPDAIPYLYLASDAPTAIAEVRPWRGATVDVARVMIVGRVWVCDLRDASLHGAIEDEVDPTWALSHILSRPQHEEDPTRYAATQLVASGLLARGFGGVLYDSSMYTQGHNLALFNPVAGSVGHIDRYRVSGVAVTADNLSAAEVLAVRTEAEPT